MAAKSTFSRQLRQEERLAWLFVLPVVLGIGIFQIYPTVFSLYASLTQWNLLTPPRWIGLDNYVDLFTTDRFFFQTMQNTGVYTFGVVVPAMIIALIFAILLNQEIRGKYLYRAIYFVPVIVPAVAVALLWNWLYEPNFGLINSALRVIGIKGPAWLGNTEWAMRAVIIQSIWAGLGFNIVIYLSGLQSIGREYYEAASILLHHLAFTLPSHLFYSRYWHNWHLSGFHRPFHHDRGRTGGGNTIGGDVSVWPGLSPAKYGDGVGGGLYRVYCDRHADRAELFTGPPLGLL